jgi:predicted transcriptional regulator of viral defense system
MTAPSEKAVQRAARAFRERGGLLRTGEAAKAGVHHATLYWMRDAGLVERLARGVYRLAELPGLSKHDVVIVARRAPSAVLCLVSALDFHGVGTQIPAAVSIAIGPKEWRPRLDCPPIRVYRMSGPAFWEGREEHELDGVNVHVFNVAKTVADCFKFRNKIGLDVAIEALQDAIRSRRTTPAQIMEYAEIDRVAGIILPYLRALQ